jgi:hypothetical protein
MLSTIVRGQDDFRLDPAREIRIAVRAKATSARCSTVPLSGRLSQLRRRMADALARAGAADLRRASRWCCAAVRVREIM